MITYAENYTLIEKPVRVSPGGLRPGQSPSGYGRKIATDKMLVFANDKRKSRVYCTLISNVGSCFVEVRGKRLYVRD